MEEMNLKALKLSVGIIFSGCNCCPFESWSFTCSSSPGWRRGVPQSDQEKFEAALQYLTCQFTRLDAELVAPEILELDLKPETAKRRKAMCILVSNVTTSKPIQSLEIATSALLATTWIFVRPEKQLGCILKTTSWLSSKFLRRRIEDIEEETSSLERTPSVRTIPWNGLCWSCPLPALKDGISLTSSMSSTFLKDRPWKRMLFPEILDCQEQLKGGLGQWG